MCALIVLFWSMLNNVLSLIVLIQSNESYLSQPKVAEFRQLAISQF